MVACRLRPPALKHLRHRWRGELLGPDDASYNAARRVWNGRIDKHPALIAYCADAADVVQALQRARDQHLPLAVRSGGHSLSGHSVCEGGVVIDLSRMKGLEMDPEQRTAWAQAGLTLGEFVRATQRWGLATTTGTVAGTGLAGLTLGGGLGWFMGKYGLTIDNPRSVQLVTADGRVLRASETEEPELFWGVRGGGGNFGIVTAFELQLHPVGPVLSGKVIYPVAQAREVLRGYREYTSTLPDELTVSASFLTTPDGVPALAITLCSCGALEEGERLVQPLRRFGTPQASLICPMSYLTLLNRADAGAPAGRCYYQKARTLKHLSDEALEVLVTYGARRTSPFSCLLIQHIHGAASRVDPAQTAFALREEAYVVSIVAAWEGGPAERHLAWTDGCWRAREPDARPGVYVNFLGEEGEEQVRAAYRGNYQRLQALKQRYDPTNVFSHNQNISPSERGLTWRRQVKQKFAQGGTDERADNRPSRAKHRDRYSQADLESRANPILSGEWLPPSL
jgi:hypothetical protein